MIHGNIRANVSDLMMHLDFSEYAHGELISSLDKILTRSDTADEFDRLLSIYDENELCDYADMLSRVGDIAKRASIHEYTATMLLYLALGERLKERYIERGIELDIFYNSLADLRYKLEECRLVYGVLGSFVGSWFQGFYKLRRFALGRLQFEIINSTGEFIIDGIKITPETRIINLHIPRTGGRLEHGEVLKSYALAAEFFGSELADPIIFHCKTWMFDSFIKETLSPNSNMVKFMNAFTMVEEGTYDGYGEVWRLFDKSYNGNPDDLPADSSLRRAYIERIKRGEALKWARGLFIYK